MLYITDIPAEAKIGIGAVAAVIGALAVGVLVGTMFAKSRKKAEQEKEDRIMEEYAEQNRGQTLDRWAQPSRHILGEHYH